MSDKQTLLYNELKELKKALSIEKEESLEKYLQFIQAATVHQKKSRGITWHPLNIKEQGYGFGDYPYIVVERTKMKGTEHRFSSGKPVELFLLHNQKEEESLQGTIQYIRRDEMKITFQIDELPYWLDSGSIGVNLLFDEKTFNEMDKAIDYLLTTNDNDIISLAKKILGHQELNISQREEYNNPLLNESQNLAVSSIINNNDISVVHGPPGTGKTTTLIQAIIALQKKEKQVLVCAPSNTATDLLTEKLGEAGLNVVRIGNVARVEEKVLHHTVDNLIGEHPQSKEVKKLKKMASEYRSMASKFKRNFGKAEREQRNALYKEAKQVANDAVKLEDYLLEDILDKADVITCTLVGANHRKLEGRLFKTVVIDEAAQALEPATWIPILKAKKVVLAGDPLQLPPTVQSDKAKKAGLEVTLIEKCLQRLPNVRLLDTQYRMNETIMGFSNKQFYANSLKAHDTVKDISLIGYEDSKIEFIDTAGCGFDEKQHEDSLSTYNEGEFETLKKHLDQLMENSEDGINIGIISPYKAQVNYMLEHFTEEFQLTENVTINTIDSFQGQERDVIYISLVRSNDSGEIGFLKDFRRMNVAMTRAKKKLVVIGDSATLGSEKFYQSFLDYVEANNGYHTAWEWM